VTATEAHLRGFIATVATAFDVRPQYVEIRYGLMDGDWGWSCIVHEQYRKHGAGKRLVRPAHSSWGATIGDCINDAITRAPGYLEYVKGGARR
jgi:hypothetical protein